MADWTEPESVVAALRRRWDRGELLTAHARGDWAPVSLAITGPRAGEIADSLDEVRAWVGRWDSIGKRRPIRVERRTVGGRVVGRNELPARAHVDTLDDAFVLLGVQPEVATYDALLAQTPDPRLRGWLHDEPLRALAVAPVWSRLLAAVGWIAANRHRSVYLRQIDAPGVDTKLVESHRRVLAQLLDRVLDADTVDTAYPVGEFALRYGFADKPDYVRWRHLGGAPGSYSELTTRVDELAAAPFDASRVIVVENEVSYLALPDIPDTVAVFGVGYSIGRLRPLRWLAERDVLYWGDIDTHGLAILSRFRGEFPGVRSVLMDRETLLAHREHWSQESKPSTAVLEHLTPAESDLCAELRADVHGTRVRLEQERVRFSVVRSALDVRV